MAGLTLTDGEEDLVQDREAERPVQSEAESLQLRVLTPKIPGRGYFTTTRTILSRRSESQKGKRYSKLSNIGSRAPALGPARPIRGGEVLPNGKTAGLGSVSLS